MDMTKDTVAILNHLGWTSNVYIVGHSLGGMVAMKLAVYYPQYSESLSLISALADASVLNASHKQVKIIHFD
jgi:pimeloyl-ACP methyl ester carboxylesterase